MRKSFKHILLAGLTIASTAMAMNAQTLTQDWKVTEGLPTAGNARGALVSTEKSTPTTKACLKSSLLMPRGKPL